MYSCFFNMYQVVNKKSLNMFCSTRECHWSWQNESSLAKFYFQNPLKLVWNDFSKRSNFSSRGVILLSLTFLNGPIAQMKQCFAQICEKMERNMVRGWGWWVIDQWRHTCCQDTASALAAHVHKVETTVRAMIIINNKTCSQ